MKQELTDAAFTQEWLDSKTDMELLAWQTTVKADLETAAAEQPDSQWHGITAMAHAVQL